MKKLLTATAAAGILAGLALAFFPAMDRSNVETAALTKVGPGDVILSDKA